MTLYNTLIGLALVLAFLKILKPEWRILSFAVLLICIALFKR